MTDAFPVILYIDDKKDNLLLVERFLAGRFRVITTENGPFLTSAWILKNGEMPLRE